MYDSDGLADLGDGMTNEELGRILLEVKDEVRATNGRVKGLEIWKAKIQGAWFVATLAGPIITGLIVAYAR